jgi:GNAT superfamily N-acetyltransferase
VASSDRVFFTPVLRIEPAEQPSRGEKLPHLLNGYFLGFDHFTFYANGRVSWVEEIMVVEEIRRHGIGRLLMESFKQWARQRQGKLISLATRRAASFYTDIGYDESATYFRKLL